MSKCIPSVRRWLAHRPEAWGFGPPSIEVMAPTRTLARMIAAEQFGIPILWSGAIRVGRIRKEN